MFQSLSSLSELNHEHILNVVNGQSFGIHIKNFCPIETVEHAKDVLYQHQSQTMLDASTPYVRIGKGLIEIKNETDRAHYHEVALDNIRLIRNSFKPYASPIDQLRLLLDEVWPTGAKLLQVNGKKCFVGICRFQRAGMDLIPHTDKLERNTPSHDQSELLKQLSVNIYLEIPEHGGELEMWDIEPSEEEYQQLQGDRKYGLDRETLPPPATSIKPQPGDLILLNPRLIHAVRPSSDSVRVALSAFVGYFGENQPLAYWS